MSRIGRVVIIGGGLAGLALARALMLRGIEAEIFEAAPELGEIGAAWHSIPFRSGIKRR